MKKHHIFCMFTILIMAAMPLCAASMNGKVRSINKEIAEKVFVQPEEYLPSVVQALTSGISGTAERVKVLHDWICDNIAYDTDIFKKNNSIKKQDYITVLKKKKAVCAGYTNLMNEMCRLAGIESIGITGYSKGFGYTGSIKKGQKTDHAWNAVKIGNRWQLIDVTWDAGFCDWEHFVKHYSTDWLYLTPEQFIFSHLPEDEQYQYLKEPISIKEFVEQPYVTGKFFMNGLAFAKEMPCYSNEIEECASWDFLVKDSNTLVNADLLATAGNFIANSCWADRISGKVTISYDVPDSGGYKAILTSRRKGEIVNPAFISIGEWEGSVLPRAMGLVQEKKVTQNEYDLLEASYEKVQKNGRYYILEDLFDSQRNSAVTKILKLLNMNTANYEEVLSVNIKAAKNYKGYNKEKEYSAGRFPLKYISHTECLNTKLIEPRSSSVEKGTKVLFSIQSKDYSGFAFVINDEWNMFNFNSSTGCYELELEVPNVDSLTLMGTKNKRQYDGILTYAVR